MDFLPTLWKTIQNEPNSEAVAKSSCIPSNEIIKPVTGTLIEPNRVRERSLHCLAGLAGLFGQHLGLMRTELWTDTVTGSTRRRIELRTSRDLSFVCD